MSLLTYSNFHIKYQLHIANILYEFHIPPTQVGFISLPFFNLWWHYGTWTYGEIACKFWLIVDYTTVTQSMIAIILISWDRYWMVTNITTYRTKQTLRLAAIIIGATWAFWYLYYILLVIFGEKTIGYDVIDYSNDCDMHINYLLNYTLYEIIGLFLVPFLIIAYLNLMIFISVKRRFDKGSQASQKNNKAAVTLGILVSAYLICWLPYHIVLLMETLGEGTVQYPIVAFVEYLLWLNSTVNPFVYVCTNPLFRQQLTKMFCCGKKAQPSSRENISTTNLATISKSVDK